MRDKWSRQVFTTTSRPPDYTTCFTMQGDSATVVGAGKEIKWDFSNTDDDVASPPTGYKQKKIEFSFKDPIYIKEGTLYWKDAPFGTHVDFEIVNKTPEIVVQHYVRKHFITDTCVIGDELNTEQASDEIPNTIKFWVVVTVPDVTGLDDCKGYISLELYRENTL